MRWLRRARRRGLMDRDHRILLHLDTMRRRDLACCVGTLNRVQQVGMFDTWRGTLASLPAGSAGEQAPAG